MKQDLLWSHEGHQNSHMTEQIHHTLTFVINKLSGQYNQCSQRETTHGMKELVNVKCHASYILSARQTYE